MKLEYIVKCEYYGKSKSYSKVFFEEKEYLNFKNWIISTKGYTNVKFLKKENTNKDAIELKQKISTKNKKEYLQSILLNTKKPVLFFKFIYLDIVD